MTPDAAEALRAIDSGGRGCLGAAVSDRALCAAIRSALRDHGEGGSQLEHLATGLV